jgi:hypothetical protein
MADQKRALFIGPNIWLATDGAIYQGINRLLSDAGIPLSRDYLFLKDTEQQDLDAVELQQHYDFLIIPGTPWLWNNMGKSQKVKNLMKIRGLYPHAQLVFLGIGSCFPIGRENECLNAEDQACLQKLMEKAYVVCRDGIAADKLHQLGIEHDFLPCPAFYIDHDYRAKRDRYDLIVWYDPTIGLSKGLWPEGSQQHQHYIDRVRNLYRGSSRTRIVCNLPEEVKSAQALGLPKPHVLRSPEDSVYVMSQAGQILSGRVHCAIPAQAMGKRIELYPFDSRAQSLEDWTSADLPELKKLWIEVLRGFFNAN